jgi:iron-sulfur cluster assembly accessory protein
MRKGSQLSSCATTAATYHVEWRYELRSKPLNDAGIGCYKVSPFRGSGAPTGSATIRLLMATVEREAIISLTEGAATKIRDLMAEEPAGEAGVLRIAVQGGGCSGFEYALGFDRGAQEGDHELLSHGVSIVVDPFSAPYVQGTEIDFVEGLQGGFAINNPNVTAACGCGHSFQVEDEAAASEASSAAGCGPGCGA